MPTHLNGASVVVTGASAGVGRAIAKRLAQAGARLTLIAREPNALEETAEEVRAGGGTAHVVPADVADAEAVFAAAESAANAHNGIDVWVNNAMTTVIGKVHDVSPDEVRRVTEVCYLGSVHGTMAALKHMRPKDSGTIVQIGSALAYRGIPLQAPYCAAKHALRGFTDSLRCELLADNSGIKLTQVHLPGVNTPQFDWARTHQPKQPRPAGPIHQPEAMADTVYEAILNPRREYWLGEQAPLMILGNMIVPDLVDRYLAETAISGQATEKPVSQDRQDNLFTPVPAHHRTRGRFDGEASEGAVSLPAPQARIGTVLGGIALAVGVGATVAALTRR